MYRIKSEKGYNVILKDMGLVLRTEKDEWVEVDEELFDNSMDAKRSMQHIVIEGKKNKSKKTETQKNVESKNVYAVPENAFVHGARTYKNPDDVFVKMQSDIVDPTIEKVEIPSETIVTTQEVENNVEEVKQTVKAETVKAETVKTTKADKAKESKAVEDKTKEKTTKNKK